MAVPVLREVAHQTNVRAPAATVYDLIADVTNWPRIFPPTVHVERLGGDGAMSGADGVERLQLWATANDTVKTWTSRRVLDRAAGRIEFRQEVPAAPVAAMGGVWTVEPRGHRESLVRLDHDYRAVDDDPRHLEWIAGAVDRNSTAELAALAEAAEQHGRAGDLLLVFQDEVQIDGSARDVFEFIEQARHWPDRLPHVLRVDLREDEPRVQVLAMDTKTAQGSVHTTESVRITFPYHTIVYKQRRPPALASVHNGRWSLRERPGGVTAASQHTVVIKPDAIVDVLGPRADIAAARDFIQGALSANSLATLGHAKAYAESRRADW